MELILLIIVIALLVIGAVVYVAKHKSLETKIDTAVTSLKAHVSTEVAAVKATLASHGGVLATLEDKAENVLTGAVADKAKSDIATAKDDLKAAFDKAKALLEGTGTTTTTAVVQVPSAATQAAIAQPAAA